MFSRIRNSDLVRVLSLLGPRKWAYVLWMMLAASTIALCFNIVLAFIMKDVLDAAIRGESALLVRALVLAGSTLAFGTPTFLISLYMMNRCIRKTMAELRVRAFSHIIDLPVSHFEHEHSGDLVSRLTNDLNAMHGIYANQIYTLVLSIIFGLAAMISIFAMEWRVGLIALFVGVLTTIARTSFAAPLRRASDAIQERLGKLTERLTDLLQSLPTTKMFHLEPVVHRLYHRENEEMVALTLKHARIDILSDGIGGLLQNLGRLGLPAVGLYLLMGDQTGIGTVWAIAHLYGNASFLFGGIGDFVASIQRALAGAGRVLELLDWPPEPDRYVYPEEWKAAPLKRNGSMVEIRDLTFSYKEDRGEEGATDPEVLRGICMSAERGQVAALVGPSGGGKSTIIKLLLGFYPSREGQIVIDGKPVPAYSLTQLRTMMAYVPQDAYLFDGTIAENIRYGNPKATREQVIAAARAANAHGFIMEQAEGYDTPVGERGAKLSGGQRQRIAIARALLKDAPILLLDEATSALDLESEQLVQDALNTLMKGRTTVAIAHRLSTIENADTIYVIDDGRVVEQGRHDQLVANGGLYTQLYKLQFTQTEAAAIA